MGAADTNTVVLCAVISGESPEAYVPLLPPGRRARLESLRRAEDRRRCVWAYLALGAALTRTGGNPAGLSYAPGGRPQLPDGPWISLSHAGDAGFAAASPLPVGVDGETAGRDVSRVIRRLCAPEETETPPEALLRLWTAKEAYLKCTGQGLRVPMTQLTLRERVLYRQGVPVGCAAFPEPPEGYAVALCTPQPVSVEQYRLTPGQAAEWMERIGYV